MKLTDLKKNLNSLSKDELLQILIDLYKKNPENRELLASKFDPEYEIIAFEKYKKKIINEFYPERGEPKLRYSNMRKALKNFKDVSSNPKLIADLMLTHVENGVKFTNEYGDIDERFYDNIAGMYLKLLKHLSKNGLFAEYKGRCLKIVNETSDIGWGFHDEIVELYYEFLINEEKKAF